MPRNRPVTFAGSACVMFTKNVQRIPGAAAQQAVRDEGENGQNQKWRGKVARTYGSVDLDHSAELRHHKSDATPPARAPKPAGSIASE